MNEDKLVDKLVDELNIHADLNNRMMALYEFIEDEKDLSFEAIVTLLQTAFWAGVEEAHNQEFRNNVTKIYLRHS